MKIISRIRDLKLNSKFTLTIILFTIIPICIFTGVIFYIMEQNVIKENTNYMNYTMERAADAVGTKIDSINMSTQFFLSDERLRDVLRRSKNEDTISADEWYQLKQEAISSLERLVNNNPLLYGVRVYANTDNVQEMMPILYQHSRMEKLSWTKSVSYTGWHFGYRDTLFESYNMKQSEKMVSLVTKVVDNDYGEIGTIESAMTMDNMFPSLYEQMEGEWSCFVTRDGKKFYGDNQKKNSSEIMNAIFKKEDYRREEQAVRYLVVDGRNLVVSYLPMKELNGVLVGVKDITKGVQQVHYVRNLFIALMILFTFVLMLLIDYIVKRLLHQFYAILRSIRQVQKGDLDVEITGCGKDEMGELGTQINKMLRRIKQLMDDNLSREMLMKNSEIRALQNQINAHFIYNVLESIKMMAEIDEEYEISDAVTALGSLLRYSMKWVSGNVFVEQELEYIKNYMALINLRFDYEIYLSLNIPEEIYKQEIPKMSLQPIVENAIYHGIEEMAEDTNIYIKGYCEELDCVIEITDSGKGMTEEELDKIKGKIAGEIESDGGSGNGIGLKNVQDRIHIAFGEGYGIEVASKLGCYTKIRVRIPMKDRKGVNEIENSVSGGR